VSDKARLIELLRKREVIRMRRIAADLGVTSAEHARIATMADKLSTLIEENRPREGEMSAPALRARLGIGVKLEAQREISANRAEFLRTEIDHSRKKLAQMKRRETLYGDRASVERDAAEAAREAAAEQLLPPGRKGRKP
jgi:hypothetical protein